MPHDEPLLTRRRFVVAGLGAVLAACAGETGDSDLAGADGDAGPGGPTDQPSPSPSETSSASPTAAPSPSASPSEAYDITTTPGDGQGLPTGIVPTRVEIPAIGVDAPCVELQLKSDAAEVPEDFGDTGWWVQTRRPGEIGPAVIGGHVDSRSGPAVFFRLRELQPGDEVLVHDDAGATRSFVVSREPVQTDKYERPPEVFGFGEGRPELRLITCGGDFNPAIGHYDSNVVAFCHDPDFEPT